MAKTETGILNQLVPFTVLGYSPGKTKDGRAYVRLDLFVLQNANYGGVGFGSRAVFLPDDEQSKAVPDIVGKVCHCDTDMFGKRANFVFLDA